MAPYKCYDFYLFIRKICYLLAPSLKVCRLVAEVQPPVSSLHTYPSLQFSSLHAPVPHLSPNRRYMLRMVCHGLFFHVLAATGWSLVSFHHCVCSSVQYWLPQGGPWCHFAIASVVVSSTGCHRVVLGVISQLRL